MGAGITKMIKQHQIGLSLIEKCIAKKEKAIENSYNEETIKLATRDINILLGHKTETVKQIETLKKLNKSKEA